VGREGTLDMSAQLIIRGSGERVGGHATS
jgi:hypothetical protein